MDHAGMSQDIEDLERYRKGLSPIKRKEYKAVPITIEELVKETQKLLEKEFAKKKVKK